MPAKIFVGTSGFMYSWNPDGLDWYITESGLDCLELNASFYRFPFPNQVKGWLNKTEDSGEKLRWIIKVNRLITHVYKFNHKAEELWGNFAKLFEPLDQLVDFYLFQLPPSVKPTMLDRLRSFIKKTGLEGRAALEARNIEWLDNESMLESIGATVVSVDAPDLPRTIFNTNGIVYERIHGRRTWYSYDYSKKELKEIAVNINKVKPGRAYILFNNDHDMLNNARMMKEIMLRSRL